MATERHSLQDLIRVRQQKIFPDRDAQIAKYQHNLGLAVDDQRRRFLFNCYGDAGVGKTYLTHQLRKIASDRGGLTPYPDEKIYDLTSVCTAIAVGLSLGAPPV